MNSDKMIINKDFYKYLPSMVCVILDDKIIPTYTNEEWFEKAWEEYRQHILNSSMDDMKMSMFTFGKYVAPKENKTNIKSNLN
jgi:hypothetical protein